jgi:hypothetical protein
VRLLALLLHLSNSRGPQDKADDEGDDVEEVSIAADEERAARDRAAQIRRLLLEGEDNDWSPPGSSGIVDAIVVKQSWSML